MSFILQPWPIMLAILCGLVNKRQQQIIEFQNAQIEALLEKLGGKGVLLIGARRAVKIRSFGDHCPSRSPASRPRSAREAFTNPGFQGSKSSFEFFDNTGSIVCVSCLCTLKVSPWFS